MTGGNTGGQGQAFTFEATVSTATNFQAITSLKADVSYNYRMINFVQETLSEQNSEILSLKMQISAANAQSSKCE